MRVVLAFIFLLLPITLWAVEPHLSEIECTALEAEDLFNRVYVSKQIDDKTLEEMLDNAHWQPATRYDFSSTYSEETFWYRFRLNNNTDQGCIKWLHWGSTTLESIKVYRRGKASVWKEQITGNNYPMASWTNKQRLASFLLPLHPYEQLEVIVQVKTPRLLLRILHCLPRSRCYICLWKKA